MEILYIFYAALGVIFIRVTSADINDFIVTEENYEKYHGNLGNTEELLLPDDDEYEGDMAEYDSCGYHNPAEKYFYGQEDGEQVIGDYSDDDFVNGDTLQVLEKMMKEQEFNINYLHQLFAQLSSNPKYAAIMERLTSEESFGGQSSCSNSPTLDVFTKGLSEEEFLL